MAPKYLLKLANSLGLSPSTTSYIVQEMTSPHRHYHTFHHLALMENYLWRKYGTATHSDKIFMNNHMRDWLIATLFHDIVYDPTRGDNEELSAFEFKIRMSDHPNINAELIEQMIIATKAHDLKMSWPMSDEERAIKWFLRADLSILWSPAQTYHWYAHGVRREYAHVPNELYRQGRAAVLEKLVNNIQPNLDLKEVALLTENVAWEAQALSEGLLDV